MKDRQISNRGAVAGALVRVVAGRASGSDEEQVARLARESAGELIPLLGRNVIGIRTLEALVRRGLDPGERSRGWLAAEGQRVARGLELIASLTDLLDSEGIPFLVIKTGDHFPDQGHDVDILVGPEGYAIEPLLRRRFDLARESRSLSEVLAAKANLRLTGVTLEVHRGRLGQVGEQRRLAEEILARRRRESIGSVETWVPAPEGRLILGLLQRIYRHFNFRICDIVNLGSLIEDPELDRDLFWESCRRCGIDWGARVGIGMTVELAKELGAPLAPPAALPLPASLPSRLRFARDFYRFSLPRVVPGAYAGQLLGSLRRGAVAEMARLLLLGPLMAVVGLNIRFFPQVSLWRKLW